ncbi:MAG TPA: hypothetical protein VEU08_12800, partial [Vicinamibacterales bacterium]|nr:hypothetical protein [Vicinamibacterales bacterium]
YGNPWAGWTVVTRSHFGGRGYVPRFAVAPRQLPAQTPFVVQSTPPTAVPRTNTFSSVSSGSVAVPRGAPTQTSVPAAPQSVATPSGQATAAKPGVQRGERRAQDAQPNPAHPGDDPAYAPHYAPPPAQAPHQSRAEPKDAEKAAPPQRAAPPPQKAPPASKPAEREKPSENGKARGRGGR